MTKVVFPTQEKLSYISKVENSFYHANYLTVLHCKGQNIDGIDIIKNPFYDNLEGFCKYCKTKHFDVLVSHDEKRLPLEELSKCGVSVYNVKKDEIILSVFSDFIQDKLVKVA
ncbi:hypothetical protein [Halarcobacter sp.]|uniref:hypothetical protein n=1 Tax=Halarcobacter sp. TaxID=2321133 RepID=UPI002AA9375C|nr:hypothetical protein [Halarcobacter sp.]